MSRTAQEKFFDNLHEWSERKLELLRKYLEGAVRILQIMGPVWYVDGFAGRGSYGKPGETQIPGSPLRAAQLAQQYRDELRSYSLRCINIEEHRSVYDGLVSCTAPYQQHVINYHGTFAGHIDQILGHITREPAVCFLDPFGVEGMDWSAIRRLIRRPGATDLWLRFDAHAVRRRAGWYHRLGEPGAVKQFEVLQRVYGVADRDILHQMLDVGSTSEELMQTALKVYLHLLRNEFVQAKGNGYVEAYRIGSLDEETQYYLIFATAAKKGIILASDTVYHIEEEYKRDVQRFKERHQSTMFGFIDPTPEQIFEATVGDLQEAILQAYRGQTRSRQDIHAGLLREWFGKIKGAHMTAALKALQKANRVTIEGTPGNERSIITLRS